MKLSIQTNNKNVKNEKLISDSWAQQCIKL